MMSDYRWTERDGDYDHIHLEQPLTHHIDDVMKYVLDDARYGEVESITVNYSNGAVRIYNCYAKEKVD
jgi:hypothetical protein